MTLRTVASALLLLTLGGLAAFAMAALGGGFSDRLDVLTHFAPLTAAGALVATLLALLISRGDRGWPPPPWARRPWRPAAP